MNDLRRPDRDETPLSQAEVMQGLREGSIPPGPTARARAFRDVVIIGRSESGELMVSRDVVEVVNFREVCA